MDSIIEFEEVLRIAANSAITAPIFAALVNLIKVVKPDFDPRKISFVVALVVVLFTWIARVVGHTDTLEQAFDFGTRIIPVLVQFITLLVAQPAAYEVGKALDVPALGYKPESAKSSETTYEALHG